MTDLNATPRANRLHIAFYGKRNAGKSSLINLMTAQQTALVSAHAGTTTDPVIKSMELFPLGPIAVVDTAGLDDGGELGELRVSRSLEMMDRTDLAVLVVSAEESEAEREKQWLDLLRGRKIPVLGVLNKADVLSEKSADELSAKLSAELNIPFVKICANDKKCRSSLLSAIVKIAPADFESPVLTGDLYKRGANVLLVMPQDKQAPKGRLILPQVQVIRDILDNGANAVCATTENLEAALASFKNNPDLVITDSQVFKHVSDIVPADVPLTSFSIILARAKGDLETFMQGARKVAELKESDKVLIAEACTHRPLSEDIGREKIPRMLRQKVGAGLSFDIASGQDFPSNLDEYALAVHCGGCMITKRQMMSRLVVAKEHNVPVTNYGILIAYLNGILDRATELF